MTTRTTRSHESSNIPVLLLYMALLATFLVMHDERRHFGREFVDKWQLPLHRDILEHRAGNPWQYRVLVPYTQEAAIQALERGGLAYDRAAYAVFMTTRYTQTFLMFVLIGWYYRRLGLSMPGVLLGIMVLLWGVPHTYFEGNQSFNTYNDVIVYVLAALAILYGRYAWIIPLTAVGVLNRETCALVPIMLLAHGVTLRPRFHVDRRMAMIAAVSLVIYLVLYWGVRQAFPPQHLLAPFNVRPGIELLRWNINRPLTWEQLYRTLGYLPLVALLWVRRFPQVLQEFFWVIVPGWFVIHFLGSSVVETRLFFVPHIVVLIPALLLIARVADRPPDAIIPFTLPDSPKETRTS